MRRRRFRPKGSSRGGPGGAGSSRGGPGGARRACSFSGGSRRNCVTTGFRGPFSSGVARVVLPRVVGGAGEHGLRRHAPVRRGGAAGARVRPEGIPGRLAEARLKLAGARAVAHDAEGRLLHARLAGSSRRRVRRDEGASPGTRVSREFIVVVGSCLDGPSLPGEIGRGRAAPQPRRRAHRDSRSGGGR